MPQTQKPGSAKTQAEIQREQAAANRIAQSRAQTRQQFESAGELRPGTAKTQSEIARERAANNNKNANASRNNVAAANNQNNS